MTEMSKIKEESNSDVDEGLKTRFDLSLKLYSMLLGHCFRKGGEISFRALELAACLTRVCVNGEEVVCILMSHLLAELIENGTVLDISTVSPMSIGKKSERNRYLKER